jgi:hypothetical protein
MVAKAMTNLPWFRGMSPHLYLIVAFCARKDWRARRTLMKVLKGENIRGGWTGEAVFSKCGRFRYSLLRQCNDADDAKLINFIMLNPSTADAMKNDPTVERCCKRAQALGYDRLIVTNVFALRSTDAAARLRRAKSTVVSA